MIALKLEAVSYNTTCLIIADSTLYISLSCKASVKTYTNYTYKAAKNLKFNVDTKAQGELIHSYSLLLTISSMPMVSNLTM